MNALAAWLEKFPPSTRILIVAGVSAFLVFLLEEMTRPSSHGQVQVVQEKAPEAPIKHAFPKSDLDAVQNIANQTGRMVDSLDQTMSQPHSDTQIICLNGLRFGVIVYINNIVWRLSQDLTKSAHMVNADDEAYIDTMILDMANSTLTVLPAMDNTIMVMTKGCNNDGTVSSWGGQIRPVLGQLYPVLQKLQAHGKAAAVKAAQ